MAWLCLLLLALVGLFTCGASRGGQTVSIAWDASASPGVAGYMVHRGTTNGVYYASYDAGTNTSINLTGLIEGQTNYFVVAAYGSNRLEGAASGQISYIVPGLMRYSTPTQQGNPASLIFPVANGHWYEVQASTNLTTWSTIWQSPTSSSNAWVTYQDPQSISFRTRFYRLLMH